MDLPSRLLTEAVEEFSKLPGIGKKTALRLVLHLLNQEQDQVGRFSNAMKKLKEETQFCVKCHNISDGEECSICVDGSRKPELVCVVESLREVIAIENTNQYTGKYHILGGVISPIDGIGPENLNIQTLLDRVPIDGVTEVIMALSPTIEGDTTIFYLSKQLAPLGVNITTIARGVAFGGELEYADELTLARSIVTRLPYENYLVNRE